MKLCYTLIKNRKYRIKKYVEAITRSCCLKVEEVDKRCSCCCGGEKQIYCDHLLTLSTPHHQHRYYQRRKEREKGSLHHLLHRCSFVCRLHLAYLESCTLPRDYKK